MATTIKTAISIQKTLFEQAEILAQQLNISRSHLFGLAIETFIKNHQNNILLDEINQAYSDQPEPNETVLLSKTRRSHRKLVESEW
ncbi:MAG: CopG family transcriptional regulator [Chloroflexi bacterium]|nr:CopG family transcriptional regulator [Chloroflexota bacterium]